MTFMTWLESDMAAYIAIYGLAFFVPALLMVAGHYFPWRGLLGKNLHENWARMYGVGVIFLIFTLLIFWLPALTTWHTVALLGACIIGAGGATVAVWTIDKFVAIQAQAASSGAQVGYLEQIHSQ